MKPNTPKKEHWKGVTFKIPLHYLARLNELAATNGMSRGQAARFLVVTHFEETAQHRVADELHELRQVVQEIRIHQALGKRDAD